VSRAPVIARRELSGYFFSPIAYVALGLFLLACGAAFWSDFVPGNPVEMRLLFECMVWILVGVVPILGMGLLAQEWASGTIETLMTAPVKDTDVVLGKFLGSIAFFVVLLAPTLLYAVLLRIYGHPDLGPIISGYLGILLVGGLYFSVVLFCSSITRSQVVAAALSAFILALVTIVPFYVVSQASLPTFWRKVMEQAVYRRYADFAKGVIDTGNIVFFIATTAVFLFLTVKVMESRRWK
jgi:ABC-2 type transport system permease protein